MAIQASATVQFGSYSFEQAGEVIYGLGTATDATAERAPRQEELTVTVSVSFEGDSFSEVEAKITALRHGLGAGSALLRITDEAGIELLNLPQARVKSISSPSEWRQHGTAVVVAFAATRPLAGAAANGATFTPKGGVALQLPDVRSWTQNKSIDRERVTGVRKEVREQVTADGHIRPPSGSDDAAARAWLAAEKLKFKPAVEAELGTLKQGSDEYPDFRLTQLSCKWAGDGSARLEWSLSGYVQCFPSGDGEAECEYDVTTGIDHATAEETQTLSGKIRAADLATAKAKAQELKSRFGAGRSIQQESETDKTIEGADAPTGRHVELTVSYTWRVAASGVLGADWTVATREGSEGTLEIIYSGAVSAETCAAALAEARRIGADRHPFFTGSTETPAYQKRAGLERCVRVNFSYSYQLGVQDGIGRVKVRSTCRTEIFGAGSWSVSGEVSAQSEAAARAFAESFRKTGLLVKAETIGTSEEVRIGDSGSDKLLRSLSFTFEYFKSAESVAARYVRKVSLNLLNDEMKTDLSGQVTGQNAAVCQGYAQMLAAVYAPPGGKLQEQGYSDGYMSRQSGGAVGVQHLESYAFSYSWGSRIPASAQVSEAEYAIAKEYSAAVPKPTLIAKGPAHIEEDTHTSLGRIVISGSAKGDAAALPALRAWASAKRALGSGSELPPKDSVKYLSADGQPDTVRQIGLSFTFEWILPDLPYPG